MSDPRDPAEEAEQLAVAEEALAEIRHDVRNKLSAIGQACEYLRRRVEATELWATEKRVPRFFGIVEEQLAVVDRLLEGGAAMEKIHRRKPGQLDPAPILGAALARARLGEAQVETSLAAGRFHADPHEAALALRQLLHNAAAVTASGGAVRVVGRPREPRGYAFVVHDEGPGFRPEDFHRAVRPFVSSHVERRGLGLAIARRIAQRWGGEVAVVESPSGGAVEIAFGDGPEPPP